MSIEGNTALVRRFIEERWGHGRLAVADELLGADAALVYRGWAARLRESYPDLHASVDFLVAEGDLVAAFWTWAGTHTGPATGPFVSLLVPSGRIEPTGKRITITGCYLFRVADGRLTGVRLEGDNSGLFQQLGVLPTAGARDGRASEGVLDASSTAGSHSPDRP